MDLEKSVSLNSSRLALPSSLFAINMVNMLPNPAFCKDVEGLYTACNSAWASLAGREQADILGRCDAEFLPRSIARRISIQEKELLITGLPQSQEFRLSNGERGDAVIRIQRSLILDTSGQVLGILGICTDLTESKRREEERASINIMAAAAEMSIMTIEGMIDPVIILESDGMIERVNKGYRELTGKKPPALGSSLTAILPELSEEEIQGYLHTCRTEGRVRDIVSHLEHQDGRTIQMLVNISILRDSRRSIDGFVVVLRDVSSLVEAKERLKTIINASEDAVALVDTSYSILAANKTLATRVAISLEELEKKSWLQIGNSLQNRERELFIKDIVDSRESKSREFSNTNRIYVDSGVPLFDSQGLVKEVALFSRDITEQKQSESLQRALYSISEAAYFAKNMDNLYRMVHRIISRLIPADNFMIGLINTKTGSLDCPFQIDEYLTAGVATHLFSEHQIKDPLAEHVFAKGKPVFYRDEELEVLAKAGVIDTANPIPRQCIGVPLSNAEGASIGVVLVRIYNTSQAYNDEDRRILNFVSSQIAMAIERKKREEALTSSNALLKRVTDGTILALVKAVELRDPYTAGHQQRVAKIAQAIAREMNLEESRIEAIHVAALLHDIGKISVPSELLAKPGALSPLEFELIRQHPITSSDLLSSIEFNYPIRRYVLEHHEKIDGSGYPNGLKGEQISLEGRIICVADVVDAMASHRPYRPSMGQLLAIEEIREHAGTLYDAEVSRAFFRVYERGNLDLDF